MAAIVASLSVAPGMSMASKNKQTCSARPHTVPRGRSATHPVHEENREVQRTKLTPFDPEDLSRRLAVVLVKQEQHAQYVHGRQTRAASEVTGVGHYVPQVAAADFARTATQDNMNTTSRGHRLAEAAIRHQQKMSSNNAIAMGGVRQFIDNDRARVEKQALLDRNQFQWDRTLEEAAEMDRERDLYRPPQRTLSRDLMPTSARMNRFLGRPMSTGDLLTFEAAAPERASTARRSSVKTKSSHFALDHHDWAQRDETTDIKKSRKIGLSWSIRKKSGHGHGILTPPSPSIQDTSAATGKPRKNSLLARLRRWEY